VEEDASFGEEGLKVAVTDEGDHEEEEPDGEEEEAGEGVGDLDQELVVRGGAQKLAGGLGAVAEGRDLVEVEHHQGAASDGHGGVDEADREEPR